MHKHRESLEEKKETKKYIYQNHKETVEISGTHNDIDGFRKLDTHRRNRKKKKDMEQVARHLPERYTGINNKNVRWNGKKILQ